MFPALAVAHAQIPTDERKWKTVIPIIAELKAKAKKLGLWNLFLSKKHYPKFGVDLTNLEVRHKQYIRAKRMLICVQYAVMAEVLGRGGQLASETVNCSAPDTGNMGTSAQLLKPSLSHNELARRGTGTLRITRTTAEVAGTSFERRNSVRICHDREVR